MLVGRSAPTSSLQGEGMVNPQSIGRSLDKMGRPARG
jgi:hypothetical protein